MEITLNQLKSHQLAVIRGFKHTTSALLRLQEQGVVPGTEVEFIRKAPLGDPYEIRVFNMLLTLRENEAAAIFVQIDTPLQSDPLPSTES
jgi:ferrous iron transport protein A